MIYKVILQTPCGVARMKGFRLDISMKYDILSDENSPAKHLIKIFPFVVVACIASIFFLDQRLSIFFNQDNLRWFWLLNREATNVALSEHYFVLSSLIFLCCKFIFPNLPAFKNAPWIVRMKTWALNFFICLITSGLALHLGKNIFGRQRPHKSPDFNPFVFEPFSFHWDLHSMPSGHAQVSFTVAALVAVLFPKKKWWIYVIATLVAFTRVVTHAHFLSDIIAGAYLGYGTSLLTLWLLKTKTQLGLKNSH